MNISSDIFLTISKYLNVIKYLTTDICLIPACIDFNSTYILTRIYMNTIDIISYHMYSK